MRTAVDDGVKSPYAFAMRRSLIRLVVLGAIIVGIAATAVIAITSAGKSRPNQFESTVWKRPVQSCTQ